MIISLEEKTRISSSSAVTLPCGIVEIRTILSVWQSIIKKSHIAQQLRPTFRIDPSQHCQVFLRVSLIFLSVSSFFPGFK